MDQNSGTAVFTCKPGNIFHVSRQTARPPFTGNDYVIAKTIDLSSDDFFAFKQDLLRDWAFLDDRDIGGINDDGARVCALVRSTDDQTTGLLVDTQGYTYARYAARWSAPAPAGLVEGIG